MEDEQPVISGLNLVADSAQAFPLRQDRLTLQRLRSWAKREATWIASVTQMEVQSDTFVFAEALKLVEEVGELSAEILGRSRLQRESKLASYSSSSLEEEVADVLLCTAILAEVLGVDIQAALSAKMRKVDGRRGRDLRLKA